MFVWKLQLYSDTHTRNTKYSSGWCFTVIVLSRWVIKVNNLTCEHFKYLYQLQQLSRFQYNQRRLATLRTSYPLEKIWRYLQKLSIPTHNQWLKWLKIRGGMPFIFYTVFIYEMNYKGDTLFLTNNVEGWKM